MKTWTIKWETMAGQIRETKVRAADLDRAVRQLCREVRVGNILEARQGGERVL